MKKLLVILRGSMFKFIRVLQLKNKRKIYHRDIETTLYKDYKFWQDYVNHEGKLYGITEWDKEDYDNFEKLEAKRANALNRYYNFLYTRKQKRKI